MSFVGDKVTVGQVCVELVLSVSVSIIPSVLHTQLHHRATLVRRTRGAKLEKLQSNALSCIRENWTKKKKRFNFVLCFTFKL